MAAVRKGDIAERYLRMDDLELVQELWDTIGGIDSDEMSDTLYWLAGEMASSAGHRRSSGRTLSAATPTTATERTS